MNMRAGGVNSDESGPYRLASAPGWRKQPETFVYALGIAALWFLFRPYVGITHDSIIYIGRALADLNPSTIGQQLSYVHDGQSKFSLYPLICRFLVEYAGTDATAFSMTVAGLALWIAAAAYLFSRTLSGRLFWAALLCLCVIPSAYGGKGIFQWGEPFATPRIFAEAALLAAIATFIDKRAIATCVLLAVAFLLHPIMAAPVAALLVLELALKDWRWALAAGVLAVLFVAAATIHLPFAGRLFVFPDHPWLEVMGLQLTTTHWSSADWSLIACQAGTAALVWIVRRDALARLTWEAGIVSAVGVALTAALPTILVLQVQPWRALWILSVLVVGQLPAVARELWNRGYRGKLALAAVLVAWSAYYRPEVVAPFMAIAIALTTINVERFIPRAVAIGLCILAGFFIASQAAIFAYLIWILDHVRPNGVDVYSPYFIGFGLQIPLVTALAVAIAVGWTPPQRFRSLLIYGATAAATVAAVVLWDFRSKAERAIDSRDGSEAMSAQIKYGDVFWMGLDKSWMWTNRPSWWNQQQMAGDVFDRALAVEWRRRLDMLVKAGFEKWPVPQIGGLDQFTQAMPLLDRHALAVLCTKGGPDWIVQPRFRVDESVMAEASGSWSAPVEIDFWDAVRKKPVEVRAYMIFECSAVERSAANRRSVSH